MDFEIRRAAAIALAAIALTQLAACATATKKLSHWSAPEDCATTISPPASSLAPDKGTVPALLVGSFGAGWKCEAIPEGHYDAQVFVRWSNGWQETALNVRNLDIAPGRILIAKAYERGTEETPAFFFYVRVQPDPVYAAGESVTPASTPEPQIAHARANEDEFSTSSPEPQITHTPTNESDAATPTPEPQIAQPPASPASTDEASAVASSDQAPISAAGTVGPSRQTVLIAAGVVLAPITLPVVAAALILQAPYLVAGALLGKIPRPGATNPGITGSGRSSADCCFVWIEDGSTGEIIAGNRPPQQ